MVEFSLRINDTLYQNVSKNKTIWRINDSSLYISLIIHLESRPLRCSAHSPPNYSVLTSFSFAEKYCKAPQIYSSFFTWIGQSTFYSMGIYLSTPKTEKFSEDGENARVRYGLSSMQGWRTTMEDAHAAYPDLDPNTSFFGVYDGHGGKVVAKFCAKFLHQQVLKNEAYLAGDVPTSLQRAYFRMDEMMRGQRGWRELSILGDRINKFTGMLEGLIWSPRSGDGNDKDDDWAFEEGPHSDFSGPTSGCTAVVAVVKDSRVFVANAGDSRCIISRGGQAYSLSRDHKPELDAEKDRILKAGGFIQAGRVNGSLNLARAIGDMEFKRNKFLPVDRQIVTASPDINTIELCEDDDFLVLACDGIWDCMSNQHLVDFIHEQLKKENKLSVVCERVLDRCLAPTTSGGEGCDNMTMILVVFKKPIKQNEAAEASSSSTTTSTTTLEPKPLDSNPQQPEDSTSSS